MKNKKEIIIVFSVFGTALFLRCLYLILLKHNYFFYDYPSSDVMFYRGWALDIARRNWIGNTVFYGMPLYPYFLAFLDRLLVGQQLLMRLAHIMLGSVNCILVYFLANRIFSRRIAILSAFLSATNFVLIYYDWLMMPTVLIITLTLFILLVLAHLDETSPKRQWFLTGVFIGLAVLADGKFLIFTTLLVIYFFARHRKSLSMVFMRIVLPLSIGVFVILGTTTLRNRIVGKDWVFISAHSGINFYIGNNPDAKGIFYNPDFLRPYHSGHTDDPRIIAERITRQHMKPSEVSRFWSKKAFSFIKSSPKKYFALLGKKCAALFVETEEAHDIDLIFQRDWKKKFDVNSLRFIFPMALLGIAVGLRRRETECVNLVIASQMLFTLLFFLITRHRATILPILIIYESYAVFWFIDALRNRQLKKFFIAAAILALLFLIFRPKALEQKKIDFLRYTKSGPIFAERGQLKKAQQQYLKALRLQPFDTNTLYNLGNAYMKGNNFAEAIKCYQKAVAINPNEVDSLYNMAYALEHTGNTQQALGIYKKLIKLDPSSIDAHFQIAKILKSQGNCDQALHHLNVILRINPLYENQIMPLIKECQ